MEYHWIESAEEFLKHEEDWGDLFNRDPTNSAFVSWDWIYNWQKHFGANGDLKILIALDEKGVFHAAAAFQVKYRVLFGRTIFREWFFLGADSVACSDHLDFLTEKGIDEDVIANLLDRVWQRMVQHDALMLTDLPNNSTSIQVIRNWAKMNHIRLSDLTGEVCPAIELPNTWEEFMGGLSTNFRSQIRRSRRKIEKNERLKIRQVKYEENIDQILDKIFLLSEWRLKEKGVDTTLKNQEMQSFLSDFIPQCLKRECAWLYVIEEGADIVAAIFCMVSNKTVSYYQAAFDPRLSSYRPGTVLISITIERAISEGFRVFDFLRGEEAYKYRWKANPIKSVSMSLVRPELSGITLRFAYRQIRRGVRWLTK